jgi:NADPH2 dehydrogenase
MVESTAVSIEGRLFVDDIGIYEDGHVPMLERLASAVRAENASVGIQLSHGGRNAIPPAGISRVAPSAIAYDEFYGLPAELSKAGIQEIISKWADAAQRAVTAGFDLIEIHAAHGYLIHQFLSPITNQRTDASGGSFENRGRLLRGW